MAGWDLLKVVLQGFLPGTLIHKVLCFWESIAGLQYLYDSSLCSSLCRNLTGVELTMLWLLVCRTGRIHIFATPLSLHPSNTWLSMSQLLLGVVQEWSCFLAPSKHPVALEGTSSLKCRGWQDCWQHQCCHQSEGFTWDSAFIPKIQSEGQD